MQGAPVPTFKRIEDPYPDVDRSTGRSLMVPASRWKNKAHLDALAVEIFLGVVYAAILIAQLVIP